MTDVKDAPKQDDIDKIYKLKETDGLDDNLMSKLGFSLNKGGKLVPSNTAPPAPGPAPAVSVAARMNPFGATTPYSKWLTSVATYNAWVVTWESIISKYNAHMMNVKGSLKLKDILTDSKATQAELKELEKAEAAAKGAEKLRADREEFGDLPGNSCDASYKAGVIYGKAHAIDGSKLDGRLASLIERAGTGKFTNANQKSLNGMATLKKAVNSLKAAAMTPENTARAAGVTLGGRRRRHTRSRKHKKSKKTRRH